MKKSKLLINLGLFSTSVLAFTAPLVSCNKPSVIETCQVVIDLNGGKLGEQEGTIKLSIDKGSTYESLGVPTKDGHWSFDYWEKDGQKMQQTDHIESDVNIIARYMDTRKIIPTDKLNINGNVLSGIKGTWEELADYQILEIPSNIVEITPNAFQKMGNQIEIVRFAKDTNGINYPLYIDESAFLNSNSIKEIILPERLTYVGKKAFSGCSGVEKLDISSWENRNLISDDPFAEDEIFTGWKDDGEIILPENIDKEDCYFIFTGNGLSTKWLDVEIETEIIPNDRFILEKVVGDESYNVYLTGVVNRDAEKSKSELTIPSNVTIIAPKAFASVYAVEESTPPDITVSFDGPPNISKIYGGAFYNCSKIKAIDFENCTNLVALGAYAFCHDKLGAEQTTDIDDFDQIKLPNNLTSLGAGCFYNNDQLNCLDLSNTSITSIPAYLCSKCQNLQEIRLNNGVDFKNIPANAFSNTKCWHVNEGVNEVTIPGQTEYIGYQAFAKSDVVKLTIGKSNNYQIISEEAFANCLYLSNVTIPGSVNYMYDGAFKNCKNIEKIDLSEFEILPTNWSSNALVDMGSENAIVQINESLISIAEWKAFLVEHGVDSAKIENWIFE